METVTHTTHDAALTLLRVLGSLDHGQRGGLGPRERLDLVEQFTRISRMVDALRATLIAEADAHNAAMAATGAPLNRFLARTGTLSARHAAGDVLGARDLTATPTLQDAALRGAIDRSQARGIVRALHDVPVPLRPEQRRAVEAELLSRAASTPGDDLARQGTEALRAACPGVLDEQAEADHLEHKARRAFRARRLRFLPERDGSVEFNGSLPVAEAAGFQNLIGVHAQAQRRATPAGPSHSPTPDQRNADALVALLNEAQACTPPDDRGPTPTGPVPPVRHIPGRERARIVVTISEADLRDRCVRAGVLPDGTHIPASQLRRLACDADILPVVLGTASEVLDVGRAARLVTPGIRRALSVRDKGCIFPGCDAPDHRCQAHHVIPFHQGGTTALTNLVLLCPHHHALLEPPPPEPRLPPPKRWEITFDAHGNPQVTEPDAVPQHQEQKTTNRSALGCLGRAGHTPDRENPDPAGAGWRGPSRRTRPRVSSSGAAPPSPVAIKPQLSAPAARVLP